MRLEGIEQADAGSCEVLDVARHQHHVVDGGGGGDEGVDDRQRLRAVQLTPDARDFRSDRQYAGLVGTEEEIEPAFQRFGSRRIAEPQAGAAFLELADRHDSQMHIGVGRSAVPAFDEGVRVGLAQFAEDVRVEQVLHGSIPKSISRGSSRRRSEVSGKSSMYGGSRSMSLNDGAPA